MNSLRRGFLSAFIGFSSGLGIPAVGSPLRRRGRQAYLCTFETAKQNEGRTPSDVLIRRYFPDGSIMDSMGVTVAGQMEANIRLTAYALPDHKVMDVLVDGQRRKVLDHQRSWIRVTGNVVVSATTEDVIGDVLHQVRINSQNARSGSLKSDKTEESGEYAFVNLSDYPVYVNVCQEIVWTGPCISSATTFVAPNAMAVYPFQQGYIVFRLNPTCSFLTAKMVYTAGSTKTFSTDTSIMFDPVK